MRISYILNSVRIARSHSVEKTRDVSVGKISEVTCPGSRMNESYDTFMHIGSRSGRLKDERREYDEMVRAFIA